MHKQNGFADDLARGLGWFSLALGAGELLYTGGLRNFLGLDEGADKTLRAYGLREVLTGVGILASADARPWVWARVAGDALDIASLAKAGRGGRKGAIGFALASVAAVTALDVICGQELQARERGPVRDYSDRTGLPRAPSQMRGAARDLASPPDYAPPEALRPYATS
jgi:hypothetical protein